MSFGTFDAMMEREVTASPEHFFSAPPLENAWPQKLAAFYAKYNPGDLHKLDMFLSGTPEPESSVLPALFAKYGLSPEEQKYWNEWPEARPGTKICCELLAATLTSDISDLKPYVKMMICRTAGAEGIPIESSKCRSTCRSGASPFFWGEKFEFTSNFQDGFFLICDVKHRRGGLSSNERLGLVVIPMRFFHPFTASTVVDSWFILKLGAEKKTGDLHLKLSVPGGVRRVTEVKLDPSVWPQKLAAFYTKFNPGEMHKVDAILSGGKPESVMLPALFTKYGLSPEDQKYWNEWQGPGET